MNIRFILISIFYVGFISSFAVQANEEQQNIILDAIKNDSGDDIKQSLLITIKQGQENKSAESILLKAIMTGTADEVKQALQPILNQGVDEKKPLVWAVLLRKPDAVKTLLECGAEIDSTVVQYAANMGDLKTMLEIVKSGVDISNYMQEYMRLCIRIQPSNPSLDIALELIQELINHGYSLNDVWDLQTNDSLNIYESFKGRALRLFLENNANPNQVIVGNQLGETPLLIAVSRRNKHAVQILLDAGADINHEGISCFSEKSTPLSCAIKTGNAEIVELLLERGASL